MLARVSRVSAPVSLSTHSRPTPLNGQDISIHGLAPVEKVMLLRSAIGSCSERPAFTMMIRSNSNTSPFKTQSRAQRIAMRVRHPRDCNKCLSCALKARTKRTSSTHRLCSINSPREVSALLSADQTAYVLRNLKRLECENRHSSGRAL